MPSLAFVLCARTFFYLLYADDLVILAESQADPQAAHDVVHAFGVRWRFSFGISPTKSAAIVFGPVSSISVAFLSQWLLSPVQCLFRLGICWRRRCGLVSTQLIWRSVGGVGNLLGWPRASPIAAVHWELGIGDALCTVFGRSLSPFGRLCAMDLHGPRPPVCASVFRFSANESGTWACWCASALRALSIQHPGAFGISAGSRDSLGKLLIAWNAISSQALGHGV